MDDLKEATRRKLSFVQTVKAVFWSFFGVRKGRDHDRDMALFYARTLAMPWLGDLDNKLLWPDFTAVWPNTGPAGVIDAFETMGPWPIPTLNTALLLTSGVTLTISHHALRANHRASAIFWLFATVVLGFVFLGFQAYEYHHAYTELNLKLTSGVYGSTFFLLTGFHGFHVMMGAIMLSVMLVRLMKGHFTPEHHGGEQPEDRARPMVGAQGVVRDRERDA